MGIGYRIKEARERVGLSQKQLAEIVGVSTGAIGNYESNQNSVKEPILYKLMKTLGVDANYLFQDDMGTSNSDSVGIKHILLPEKAKLLDKIEQLNETGCEKVSTYIDGFIDNPKYLNATAAEDAAQQDLA